VKQVRPIRLCIQHADRRNDDESELRLKVGLGNPSPGTPEPILVHCGRHGLLYLRGRNEYDEVSAFRSVLEGQTDYELIPKALHINRNGQYRHR